MAGTGKSTISRTLAQVRNKSGDLGATFFFKRGVTDRANLKKFVSTLARQLARNVPGLDIHVKAAIDVDSTIVEEDTSLSHSQRSKRFSRYSSLSLMPWISVSVIVMWRFSFDFSQELRVPTPDSESS
ncbi:hypothetical protein M441DRAFT_402135 [Trichoderma asperellum CBS 433.97]|uniref:Nephrocystin 3-like N-terminal domain-containing protein n=1 Tax=Trichoderma asperellum (strain ATCC 204424 / CBS 433.97 / NBRC 101777) TaxID=1042311 RepID=A0A2T3Z9Z7_TRIA4|nr:hypothetical protein M441DRAFT_402135 [Trichoderma asperellum CBS 433.97]PTB41638.1 hypothetical protein M441DRAFT_402135 [Trichoderma asperellum CBS 433.97]